MVLMDIFDACDLDDNGTLSREEFNIYNVRTGDEQVTDDEWRIVKENFDQKNGEITIKGFLNLHQLEAEDSSDTEDMWISLYAMGYNHKLQLDEACVFLLQLYSNRNIEGIRVSEIQPVSQRLWETFARHLSAKGYPLPSSNDNLRLCCYKNDTWAALIVENKASENLQAALSLDGSQNVLVSPENVVQRNLIFRAVSTSILCFMCRNTEKKEWKIQAELTAI